MSSQWVPMGGPCGISRRPNSIYMLCPQDIGRDSWDKQEAGKPQSKQNGGQPETTASTGKQGQPQAPPVSPSALTMVLGLSRQASCSSRRSCGVVWRSCGALPPPVPSAIAVVVWRPFGDPVEVLWRWCGLPCCYNIACLSHSSKSKSKKPKGQS